MGASVLLWVTATLLEATIVSAQEGVVFLYAAVSSAVKYGVLAVLAWPLIRVSARLTLAPRRVCIASHLLMGVLIIVAWQAAYYGFLYLQLGSLALLRLEETAWWQGLNAVLTYTVLAATVSAVQASRRLAAEHARQAEVTLLARDAELTSLKAQLRPHFLFNTLNSIYSLIESRPDQAQEMVALLGDLLRQTLESSEDTVVPLRSELQIIETYLGIEKVRLGHRLQVRIEVPSDVAELLVPPLILQPLVENAVKHGIAASAAGGSVEVGAARVGDVLDLVVRDTGRGLERGREVEGRGLEITRRRLEAMYGDAASLSLENGARSGCEVRVRLPVETTAPSLRGSRDG